WITAAHLSALGHATSLATMLPSASICGLIRPELEASEIDLSLSTVLPEEAGLQITVAMAGCGDRAFLTRRAGPAFPRLSSDDLARCQARHVHIGEVSSLVSRPEIIDIARANGMSISVDCGWDDGLDARSLRRISGLVDVFLPNEAEWAWIEAIGLGGEFAPITIVKRGASGASAIWNGAVIEAGVSPIEALDTTGAGDAFNAGFLSHWLTGRDLPDCLAAGNSRAALTLRRSGGFSKDMDTPSNVGAAGG
ncbi:MAG: PfkB family carbohydrate kinase, partial [Pseudomonadota bacterium]